MLYHEIMEGQGVSNVRGLRQYALSLFDRKFDRLYPAGKMRFKLPDTSIHVIVQLGPGLRDMWYEPKRFGQPYKVTINSDGRNKLQIRQVLVHEITHLSQARNRSMEHAERLMRRFAKQNNIGSEWEARLRFHRQNPIEQEARLAEVLDLMQAGETDRAAEELWWEADYFQLLRRDWLRKAIAFGVDRTAIKATERAYAALVARQRDYLTSRPDIAEKVRNQLARQRSVMRMLAYA